VATAGEAQFHISRTIDELVYTAATGIVDIARASIAARGTFSIALSGGSTPRLLYEVLADPSVSGDAPWNDIQIFWGDERHVPPDHPESNYRMAREALLDRVTIPAANIHRIHAELPNPTTAAVAYADELVRSFGLDRIDGDTTLPRFDLILLGLGEDGHTASLFPHSPALQERRALVAANLVPKLSTTRITLTIPVLNNAARVWFLVTGGSKAAILEQVLEGPVQPDEFPAQYISPIDGELLYQLDSTAAANLSTHLRASAIAGLG
jgi:6-phosphogluconolactonase